MLQQQQEPAPTTVIKRHYKKSPKPKMTTTVGKTPITILQEYATKHAITPQYDLIANEGAVHEPTFIVRVTVGEYTATGRGCSKKKAKHAAAQKAMNKVMGVDDDSANDDNDLPAGQTSDKEDDARHPVGELQEFTQKKLLKPPVYEFINEQRPPHVPDYVCNIKLGKYTERGVGRSKKQAKRDAAAKMLTLLQSISTEKSVEKELDDSEEEDIPLEGFNKSVYSSLRRDKNKSADPKSSEELLKFYEKVMVAGGKKIRPNGQSVGVSTPTTNYCQMLQEIAEVQRFEVQYFDIKDRSTNGLNQCLVQLSTVPVAVCQGTGPVMDEAHANAAHNALQYLRIMIK